MLLLWILIGLIWAVYHDAKTIKFFKNDWGLALALSFQVPLLIARIAYLRDFGGQGNDDEGTSWADVAVFKGLTTLSPLVLAGQCFHFLKLTLALSNTDPTTAYSSDVFITNINWVYVGFLAIYGGTFAGLATMSISLGRHLPISLLSICANILILGALITLLALLATKTSKLSLSNANAVYLWICLILAIFTAFTGLLFNNFNDFFSMWDSNVATVWIPRDHRNY